MSLEIRYLHADREIEEAAAWYESQQTGLGKKFRDEVERATALAADHPKWYPVLEGNVRLIQLRQFAHYCIYFRVRGDRLFIVSVFHQSRQPESWQ